MPERRTIRDADGAPVAHFLPLRRDGRDVADLLELEVPVERALPTILADLRGWRVAGPVELGHALIAAGARPWRHAHVYSHDLRERPVPRPPAGITLTPVDRPAAELLPSFRAAHPPEHVDYAVIAAEDSEAELASTLRGLLAGSGLAITAEGRVAGAILLNDAGPPFGGQWVMELFRDPRDRGAGRALLERALALAEGPTLGLTVTHGNPAERLYQELGFKRVLSAYSVDL